MATKLAAVPSPTEVAAIAREGRNATIASIRKALRTRSGKTWSVKGGRGSSWGWIEVSAPPARLDRFDMMSAEDQAALAGLMGREVGRQFLMVPAGTDFRHAALERAWGLPVTVTPVAYWD